MIYEQVDMRKPQIIRHSRVGGNPARKTTRVADKNQKLISFAGVFQSPGFSPTRA
jgi:hypothetical protein